MLILTLNAGSNSLKFEIVGMPDDGDGGDGDGWGKSVLAGSFDDVGKKEATFSLMKAKKVLNSEKSEAHSCEEAAHHLFEWLAQGKGKPHGVGSLETLDRVAHRIVHGADQFTGATLISDAVVEQIGALEELAPLHNGPARKVIQAARSSIDQRIPQFAVFDTAFHRSLPEVAALYPLPVALARRHRIRRYGFHGVSHHYLALRTAQLLDRPIASLRLITLHLEGGCSAAAIRNGKSVDTSMGFTPLEGLMMGTRSGDLDPAIPLYLMRKEGWDTAQTERFLNKECGLLGLSGSSADTRELRKQTADPAVDMALDVFCYRVKKYIGSYLAVLGGADAIVFGGGISENTPLIRERICSGLEWCGARFDAGCNAATIDREGSISAADATLPLWVVPTQEGLMLAREAWSAK